MRSGAYDSLQFSVVPRHSLPVICPRLRPGSTFDSGVSSFGYLASVQVTSGLESRSTKARELPFRKSGWRFSQVTPHSVHTTLALVVDDEESGGSILLNQFPLFSPGNRWRNAPHHRSSPDRKSSNGVLLSRLNRFLKSRRWFLRKPATGFVCFLTLPCGVTRWPHVKSATLGLTGCRVLCGVRRLARVPGMAAPVTLFDGRWADRSAGGAPSLPLSTSTFHALN